MHRAELVLRSEAILGEGTLWDWEQERLLWVDIIKGEIHAFDPSSGRDRMLFHSDRTVGTIVRREGGGLVAAVGRSICLIDEQTDGVETLVTVEDDKPCNRFNDGKCDPAGRFWAGTMDHVEWKRGRGSLYRLGPDRACERILDDITISNGIAWSPDGATMYYTDTATRVIWAFDFDVDTGTPANRRVAVEIPAGEGGPDGFTVDAEGMLWVAQWNGWQVGRYEPATGKKLGSVAVPAEQVSSCTFGGRDLNTLFITTARDGLSAERLAEQPLAGNLFAVNVGVRGLNAAMFKG